MDDGSKGDPGKAGHPTLNPDLLGVLDILINNYWNVHALFKDKTLTKKAAGIGLNPA